jgi:hypothetical protein
MTHKESAAGWFVQLWLLCHFNRVTKWPGQEERYRSELALRARQAEAIATALRASVKASEGQP